MQKHHDVARFVIAGFTAITVVGTSLTGVAPALAQTRSHTDRSVSSKVGTESISGPSATASPTATRSVTVTVSQSVHVPILSRTWPLDTIFGTETANVPGNATVLTSAGVTWLRKSGLDWYKVEPTEGARDWSTIAAIEADMVLAAQKNIRIIPIIYGTPSWARGGVDSTCSRIREDKIAAFAKFVGDAVERYSKPPYSVKYWEIWNEPDLPSGNQPNELKFGCWGDTSDQYYGGAYYAAVLKQVSPAIRAASPSAKIVMGGLLFDAPANGSYPAGNYLEGIIRGGGAPYFDIVNFHAYDGYDQGANALGHYNWNDAWGTKWNTTGPTTIAKARSIKALLSKYGITGKQLINTEAALVCWQCVTAPSNFEASKAYYVAEVYGASVAEGLVGNLWYSWEGWFLSGVYSTTLDAYKTASVKLGAVSYVADITASDVGTSGVRGYKYTNSTGKPLWLMWSADGGTKSVKLTSTPTSVIDAVGISQTVSTTISLTVKPLYIELP